MTDYKIEISSKKLIKALMALEQIVEKPHQDDRSNIDATIQRFEFTVELFWKLLKVILESKWVNVQYPKDMLREAFKGHLIDNESIWLNMLRDRNLTSHTYDEQFADEIYLRIKSYVPTFKATFEKLSYEYIKDL